jgi:hypothetical protein
MAKGDGREVGDRERTGSSCVFISYSWYTREQLTSNFYYCINTQFNRTTEYLYNDHV